MKLPAYLKALNLPATQLDYDWDTDIFNEIRESTGEDNPRLAEALQLISVKASFALGVACSEWVAARVEGRTETAEALARIEACWAAAIHPSYATLSPPPPSLPSAPPQFASPLRLSMKLLSYAHSHLTGEGKGVRRTTQGLVMLVNHIAGRQPVFSQWLTESLRRCHAHFPRSEAPVEKERPVPQELFEPDFVWSEVGVEEALKHYVQTLDPARNAYLRPAEAMRADGFEGDPYPRSI